MRHAQRLASTLAALLGLAHLLTAQRELVLQNLTPFAHREVAAVVVPFAQGEVADLPDLHIAGAPTAWQPFGARWPDGSLRQAICLWPARLEALREVRVQLEAGPGEPLPTTPIDMPDGTIEFVLQQGTSVQRAVPTRVRDLEANPMRRVELRRARLGELIVELIVTAGRDQPHAYVDAAVFCSDPRSQAMQCQIDQLAIESHGRTLVFRHAGRLGVQQNATKDGSRVVLLQKTVLGDGQGLRRTGALLPPLAGNDNDAPLRAASLAPLLGACDWRRSGAFGAFGLVPEPPPWLRGNALRDHLAQRHQTFVAGDQAGGDPFARGPLGLAKQAGQTGDQFDFGIVKLSLVAGSGLPSQLFEAEASVLQEACRPVHFYEADGSPVLPAAHPDWVVWSGRTHWHPKVSPDRLGKPVPEPKFEAHGWTGKDRQHWSSNYLGAFALLTGAHWARQELENETRLYLAGQTIDPGRSTSGAGAPRGTGRTQLAATWMLLVTGDPALRQRMIDRVEQVEYPGWSGRELPADQVRPFAVNDSDPRMLQGKGNYWNPWQEAIAATGIAAVHRVTGNQRAHDFAEALAINCVRHGWRTTADDSTVALALRWTSGQPLSPAELLDPTFAQWSSGSGISQWALGACEIARQAALRTHDEPLAQRAATIQRHVRASRARPSKNAPDLGGLDRLTEWDAVTWQ